MSGFFWAGDVLVNLRHVTHIERAESDGKWFVKVKVLGVNADSTSFFPLSQSFTSEAEAEAAMVAIAAGVYTP